MVITGHSGPFQEDLGERFNAYENIVYQRDRKLLWHLDQPRIFSSLLGRNLIYPQYREPQSLIKWFEQVHLEKHLDRLQEMGEVIYENGVFRKA
jgi:hypothetical protein